MSLGHSQEAVGTVSGVTNDVTLSRVTRHASHSARSPDIPLWCLRLPDASPVTESDIVLGAGQEHHVGEAADEAHHVEDDEADQQRRLGAGQLVTAEARVHELSPPPQPGVGEAEAGLGGPGGGATQGRGAGGGGQGDQVQRVADGGHEAEHTGHEADPQADQDAGGVDGEHTGGGGD